MLWWIRIRAARHAWVLEGLEVKKREEKRKPENNKRKRMSAIRVLQNDLFHSTGSIIQFSGYFVDLSYKP